MPRAGKPHNEPTFKVRSLSTDHPLNDDTPTHIHAITRNMLGRFGRIAAVAKLASETTPSRTGCYPNTMFVNAKRDGLSDEDGIAVLARAPRGMCLPLPLTAYLVMKIFE